MPRVWFRWLTSCCVACTTVGMTAAYSDDKNKDKDPPNLRSRLQQSQGNNNSNSNSNSSGGRSSSSNDNSNRSSRNNNSSNSGNSGSSGKNNNTGNNSGGNSNRNLGGGNTGGGQIINRNSGGGSSGNGGNNSATDRLRSMQKTDKPNLGNPQLPTLPGNNNNVGGRGTPGLNPNNNGALNNNLGGGNRSNDVDQKTRERLAREVDKFRTPNNGPGNPGVGNPGVGNNVGGKLPGNNVGSNPGIGLGNRGTGIAHSNNSGRPRDATLPGNGLPDLKLDSPKVKDKLDKARRPGGLDSRPLTDPNNVGLGDRKDNKGPVNSNPGLGGNQRGDGNKIGLGDRKDGVGPVNSNPGLDVVKRTPNGKFNNARLDKNGLIGDLNKHPDLSKDFHQLKGVRKQADIDNFFVKLKDSPDFKNTTLANININNFSGNFQKNIHAGGFDPLVNSNLGKNIHLGDQYHLYAQGDVSRQLNLHNTLVVNGGWTNRYVGPVYPNYVKNAYSAWYPGPGFYPAYCWMPTWSPWVSWCHWDYCHPLYDPRPFLCRPIYYDPCPPIVVYQYPVFQPLPVVTCGTWVDYEPVIVDTGFDLQLLAVRFVDPGHPDQDLGTRFRIWLTNNSRSAIGQPFNVTLLAANGIGDQSPSLPQAGVTVPSIDAGETISVDVRLPAAANRMGVRPDGHRVPFSHLHVLVDSRNELAEADKANNGAVLVRGEILPVDPAAFSTDVTAAAPGALVSLAGEGFGPEPGQVIVSVDGVQQQAEIYGWYDLGIHFKVPGLKIATAADAQLIVIRGDGAASNPVALTLAADQLLSAAPPPALP